LEFEDGMLDETAAEMFQRGQAPDKKTKQQAALDVAREILTGGPMWSTDVWRIMKDRGVPKRTVEHALHKSDIVVSERMGLGKGQRWFMRLAEHAGRQPTDA
jgi:hypothetical protein